MIHSLAFWFQLCRSKEILAPGVGARAEVSIWISSSLSPEPSPGDSATTATRSRWIKMVPMKRSKNIPPIWNNEAVGMDHKNWGGGPVAWSSKHGPLHPASMHHRHWQGGSSRTNTSKLQRYDMFNIFLIYLWYLWSFHEVWICPMCLSCLPFWIHDNSPYSPWRCMLPTCRVHYDMKLVVSL